MINNSSAFSTMITHARKYTILAVLPSVYVRRYFRCSLLIRRLQRDQGKVERIAGEGCRGVVRVGNDCAYDCVV